MAIPDRTAQAPRPAPLLPIGAPPSQRRGNDPPTIPQFPEEREWVGLVRYTYLNVGDGMVGKRRGKGNAAAQKQVGGPGTLIQVHYGLRRVGARIGAMIVHSGALYLLCVWGEGEIDAVEQIFVNDEAMPAGVTATHYLGTASQAADPSLVTAFAAAGQVYSDTLPNIAYSVVRVPPKKNSGFPEVSARVRGRKVPTTSGGTPTYSTCPAYIIADLIENTRYGLGATVNWDDVAALAARNNGTVGGETRHVLSVSIDSPATAEQWLLTLCDYASAIPVKEGDTYRLFLDAPGSSVATLTKADIVENSLRWDSRAPYESPTVIEVGYTDTSESPWKDASAFVYATGVEAGTVERRVSKVSKPGIQRYSEAYRYGVQLLNSFQTSDLTVRFDAFDEAIEFLPGDVITVDATPFTAKDFRVLSLQQRTPQLWSIVATEYDAAKWSDTVVSGPSNLDTTLPSPFDVDEPTGLAVSEDVFQIQTGRYGSRLVVSWTGPTRDSYVFLEGFVLTVSDGTTESTWSLPYDQFEFTTPALPENTLYTVSLKARSEFAESDAALATLTNSGKLAVPSDVSSIAAYGINGETRASWPAASDLDLTSYEIRYSAQSGTWEAATTVGFVAAPETRFVTTLIPAGARRVWIKAHDSVRTDAYPNGQESVNAAYVDYTLPENSAYTVDEFELSAGTLTNMVQLDSGYWVTSFGSDSWDALFTGAMDGYTNAVDTYHASGTSSIVSADVDAGASETCTVSAEPDYSDLSGTGQAYIEHKVNSGDSWTRVNALSTTVTARYFRVGIEWTTTETGIVQSLGSLRKVT